MADFWTRLDGLTALIKTDLGQAALAGAAGGAIRWITLREKPRDGVVSLLVGSVCAIYAGPLVEPFLAPLVGQITPGNDADGFASFVVGIGGISITGALIDIFRGVSKRAGGGTAEARPIGPTGPLGRDPNAPEPDLKPDLDATGDDDFPGRPTSERGNT